MMQERNVVWQQRFGLVGCPFRGTSTLRRLSFVTTLITWSLPSVWVGTTSLREGTFLWGWANENIPLIARRHLELVREFGIRHQLQLLATPQFTGGRPEALEMLAIAARVLDAEGVFIDSVDDDLVIFFALTGFQTTRES